MTIDITRVYVPAGSTLDSNQVDLSMGEYLEITRKLAYSLVPMFGLNTIHRIVNSEDVLSNIATELMIGDWRFDGRGHKEGFRKKTVEWAIRHYLARAKGVGKRKQVSINHDINWSNGEGATLGSVLYEMTSKEPEASVRMEDEETRDMLNGLILSGILTDKQFDSIKEYYVNGKSMSAIAKEKNISKEAVRLSIKHGITKLKELAVEKNICP